MSQRGRKAKPIVVTIIDANITKEFSSARVAAKELTEMGYKVSNVTLYKYANGEFRQPKNMVVRYKEVVVA